MLTGMLFVVNSQNFMIIFGKSARFEKFWVRASSEGLNNTAFYASIKLDNKI